jgi:hypothetical protein
MRPASYKLMAAPRRGAPWALAAYGGKGVEPLNLSRHGGAMLRMDGKGRKRVK